MVIIMKKINIARCIWISSIFLELIVVLVMIMDYKINYQQLNNKKIYFYDCKGLLTVTEVENKECLIHSTYECGYDECPSLKSELEDNYVILSSLKNSILFDYKRGETILNKYDDYKIIGNNYIIVKKNNYYGLVKVPDDTILEPIYDEIGYTDKEGNFIGYSLDYILVKKENKYGVASLKSKEIIEKIEHNESEVTKLIDVISTGEFIKK